MKNFKTLFFYLLVVICFVTCGSENEKEQNDEGINISNLSLVSCIELRAESAFKILGNGFQVGDRIVFKSSDNSEEISCEIIEATNKFGKIIVPSEMTNGRYKITIYRKTKRKFLKAVWVSMILKQDIPNSKEMNVKGFVGCGSEPLAGVVVSDGNEVSVTDENGIYYLKSSKKTGFVFISIPGNYEVPRKGSLPFFYQELSSAANKIDQRDFSLVRVDNTNHILLPMADLHLAAINEDLTQFSNGFLKDINLIINNLKKDGVKIYGLALGDLSWDAYWYSSKFALPEYVEQMNKLECPVFSVIGNHDNDPYSTDDWQSEQPYRDALGPTYYSFNLGKIHYVVLDDVEYINDGGSNGVLGKRNYNGVVTKNQIEWLKKDLAMIKDKSTPVVLAMHIPIFSNPTLDSSKKEKSSITLTNGKQLLDCFSEFTTVEILSGHIHMNYAVEHSDRIFEHNIAAVCATWWMTGQSEYSGNHICRDGSPGGYAIWKIKDRDIEWKYKSIGYNQDYQFRTYDLNQAITAEKYAPNLSDERIADYVSPYGKANENNEILINVWGFDKGWSVEVFEEGTKLTTTRVSAKDPLHIISYDLVVLNKGKYIAPVFFTALSAHFFKAKASSPTSTLEIKVTDRFGNVYTESMARPKILDYQMR